MILGDFSAALFFRIGSTLCFLTLVLIYWISQYLGHQPPFPNCWISGVAHHYPEFIFFRIATIAGSILFVMGWFTNYFYLKTIAFKCAYNLSKLHPQIMIILGQTGAFFLMLSTALIDTGVQKQKLHQLCARMFFICTVLAQLYNTILSYFLYCKTKALNKNILICKTIIAILIILQIVISVVYGVKGQGLGFTTMNNDDNNITDKFIEWSLTLTLLFGFVLIGYDCHKYVLVYEKKDQLSENEQN